MYTTTTGSSTSGTGSITIPTTTTIPSTSTTTNTGVSTNVGASVSTAPIINSVGSVLGSTTNLLSNTLGGVLGLATNTLGTVTNTVSNTVGAVANTLDTLTNTISNIPIITSPTNTITTPQYGNPYTNTQTLISASISILPTPTNNGFYVDSNLKQPIQKVYQLQGDFI